MWKFRSASDQGGHPYLVSLNGCKGRQTWEFDATAGSPEQRAKVEELRAKFTANKLVQHHSADELLRLQCADKIASKNFSPPTAPLEDGDVPSPERVEEHIKGAISFYECLQQEDGHFPGVQPDSKLRHYYNTRSCLQLCGIPSLRHLGQSLLRTKQQGFHQWMQQQHLTIHWELP